MKKLMLAVLALVIVLVVLVAVRSSKVSPEAFTPAQNPGLTGPYAPNTALANAERLIPGAGHGPEDIARGPDGLFYTGFADGRIVRFDATGKVSDFVNTGGRALGMQFDADGRLIVADGVRGLLSISPDGQISLLTDSVNDQRMIFVDDLDIAADGTIWFSDASMRFGYGEYIYDFIESSATGRLLSYTRATGVTRVHMDKLFFANGVALGPDDAFVLINETGTGRIHRLWLKGERAGQRDLFHAGLPGMPDNLSFNGRDTFWVALPSIRSPDSEVLAERPGIRKLVAALPRSILETSTPYGFVLGLGLDGQVRVNLQDPSGRVHAVTSVNEFDGQLYIGSLALDSVSRIAVP